MSSQSIGIQADISSSPGGEKPISELSRMMQDLDATFAPLRRGVLQTAGKKPESWEANPPRIYARPVPPEVQPIGRVLPSKVITQMSSAAYPLPISEAPTYPQTSQKPLNLTLTRLLTPFHKQDPNLAVEHSMSALTATIKIKKQASLIQVAHLEDDYDHFRGGGGGVGLEAQCRGLGKEGTLGEMIEA